MCLYFQALTPDDFGGGCGLSCHPLILSEAPYPTPLSQTHTHSNHGDDPPFQQFSSRPYEMGQWKSLHLKKKKKRITITIALFCLSLILTLHLASPVFYFGSPWGVLQPHPPCFVCSDALPFVLPGWVAGLRGGVVQHGPDASQQYPGPEEDDVILGSQPEVQSWGPADAFTAQPQPPWAPSPPWTRPSQSYGTHFRWELSTTGERNKEHFAIWKFVHLPICCYFFTSSFISKLIGNTFG